MEHYDVSNDWWEYVGQEDSTTKHVLMITSRIIREGVEAFRHKEDIEVSRQVTGERQAGALIDIRL